MSFYTLMHTLLKNSTKLGLFPSLTLSSRPTFFLKHWRIQPRSLTAPSIQHVLCLLKRWLHIKALLNTGLCCFMMSCSQFGGGGVPHHGSAGGAGAEQSSLGRGGCVRWVAALGLPLPGLEQAAWC